jgi:hypothetical protein
MSSDQIADCTDDAVTHKKNVASGEILFIHN